jgi:hypothetical protein
MASRAELLARVRAKQQVGSTPAKPLRIILEFENTTSGHVIMIDEPEWMIDEPEWLADILMKAA